MTAPDVVWQREQTRLFIDLDPTDLVLIPMVEQIQPNGTKKRVPGPPRPVQRVKLIPMTYDQRPTVTLAGVERIIDYHILGVHTAVIQPGDHWVDEDGGTWYEVIAMADGHDYEVKALVERHLPKG